MPEFYSVLEASMFDVDVAGLARKLGDRPPHLLILELIQNAWDEDSCTRVTVNIDGSTITVEDDAEGFASIESAWTLFRDSKKAADPTKRGRFELGEKLLIACSQSATIETVGHTVVFDPSSATQREVHVNARERGTRVTAALDLDADALLALCRRLIPPVGIETIVNGKALTRPDAIGSSYTYLSTVQADASGAMRDVYRFGTITVYGAPDGEGWLFEMGIPVCKLGAGRFHADVDQRVPVDWCRAMVPSWYLQRVRTSVLEAIASQLTQVEACATWVTEALDSILMPNKAVRAVIAARYGERVVADDPAHPEATKKAMAAGWTVVPLSTFTFSAWTNIRDAKAIRLAGEVFTISEILDPENVVPVGDWTDAMLSRACFAVRLHARLLPAANLLDVTFANVPEATWIAHYRRDDGEGNAQIAFNLAKGEGEAAGLPNSDPRVIDLLLHEFAHDATGDHLSSKYHDACTRLGALAVEAALQDPMLFDESGPL